jgi:tetratricopeptide (TPR) repeat protein
VHGRVFVAQARWEEAQDAYQEAVSLAQDISYPYAEAAALYELGQLYKRHGKVLQGRDQLRKALAIFRRLSARTDIERTEQELTAFETSANP